MLGVSLPTLLSPPLKTPARCPSRTKASEKKLQHYAIQILTRLSPVAMNKPAVGMDHPLYDLCLLSQIIMMNSTL